MVAVGRDGLDVVLRENAVVKNSDVRGPSQLPGCAEARAMPDDVVGLPLAGCARSIHQRREYWPYTADACPSAYVLLL